jgi:hypothetical protein
MKNSISSLNKFSAAQLLPTGVSGQALWRQLLLCCVLGIASTAQGNPVAAGVDKPSKATSSNEKVDICHNGHVITVSVQALPAHLAHGDKVGSCSSGGDNGGYPIIMARNNTQSPIAGR